MLCLVGFCLVWILPAFASAQECEERGHLRICPEQTEDGTRLYRVTAHSGASYQEVLDFANEGIEDARQQITPQQFDDRNAPYIIYYCPGTTMCRGNGICRNGVFPVVNGDDVARHYDTVCDGTGVRASRGLVAGVTYRVPARRVLTATEVISDRVATLEADLHPTVASIRAANEAIGVAGEDTVHPPSTLGLARAARATAAALARIDVTPAAVVAPTPVVAPVVVAAPIVDPVSTTEVATDDETKWPWWVTIIVCALGMAVTFYAGRKTAPNTMIDMTDSTRNLLKLEQEQKWKPRVEEAENAAISLRKQLDELRPVANTVQLKTELEGVAKRKLANAEDLVSDLRKQLEDARRFVDAWVVTLTGKTPQMVADAFQRIGTLSADLVCANESKSELVAQNQALAIAITDDRATMLKEVADKVRAPLYALWRGVYGSILRYDPEVRRRVVDAQRVKEFFSSPREVILASTNGPRRRRNNGHGVTETVVFNVLKGPEATHFHREVHDAFDAVMNSLDAFLGTVSDDGRHDLTPPPGAFPPPPPVPAELSSLLDNPDETPTAERGLDEIASEPTVMRRVTDIGVGGSALKPREPIATLPEEDPASAESREE